MRVKILTQDLPVSTSAQVLAVECKQAVYESSCEIIESAGYSQRLSSRTNLRRVLALPCVLFLIAISVPLRSEQVKVRHRQGSMHGFLVIKTTAGVPIAVGDVTQSAYRDQVRSRLVFRFKDGSVDEDDTIFTQKQVFRLVSDHHIQHGPSFPKPIDVLINASTGQITSRSEDGKVTQLHLDLPTDVANGLPPNLLLNLQPTTPETKLSFVVPSTKPRLISISVKPDGEVPFKVGGSTRKATDYVLHVQLGGITGLIAPVIGKEPADYHIWILGGSEPAFVREEGQFYEGGPIWRVEQISPSFSQ